VSNEKKEEKSSQDEDDLQTYFKEMETLEENFSDLDDLDMEEIQEMREAIDLVKEEEGTGRETIQEIQKQESLDEQEDLEISEEASQFEYDQDDEQELIEKYKKHKGIDSDLENSDDSIPDETLNLEEDVDKSESVDEVSEMENFEGTPSQEELLTDFSDLGKMDLNELLEMKKAVETVKKEKPGLIPEGTTEAEGSESMEDELERRLQEELEKQRKEKEKPKVQTEESFLEYLKDKRDKIWYHALNYLVYEIEDHTASKNLLYDELKEVTSKSAIDPIAEHQFYFGLGYLLRLTFKEKQVVRYQSGGKFKINMNIEKIKEFLEKTGDPISTRPIIEEEKKKKMFMDFLKDDFSDL
jgi:hypothetical protein